MKVAKKAVLRVLFGFGRLATVCSVGKTINLSRITQVTDITYFLATLIIWNATEMYIVILAGSVPTLRPFVKRHFLKSTTNRDYRKGASHRLDDAANFTNSSFAHGHTKSFAMAKGKSSGDASDERDSTEDFIHDMGRGSIMMTTQIDVDRYSESRASTGTALYIAKSGCAYD